MSRQDLRQTIVDALLEVAPDVDASINAGFGNRDTYADVSRLRDAACSGDQRG